MPTQVIPLSGAPNRRGLYAQGVTKDQRFIGAIFTRVPNAVARTFTDYLERRPGFPVITTPASGKNGRFILRSPSLGNRITAFETGGTTTIYLDTTSVGTLGSGRVVHGIIEVKFSGTTYWLISANDVSDLTTKGEGYYLASDAASQTSYTGTLNSNTLVTGIASTAGMYSGQPISATGIPANTRIQSVDSSSQITLTAAATQSGSRTLTKTPLAKIIDADFPADCVGSFQELNGTLYIATHSGNIRNSDLNSVSAWSATGSLSADMLTDGLTGLAKYKDLILAFGPSSVEGYQNSGNAAGSPLSRVDRVFSAVGARNVLTPGPPITACGDYVAWLANVGGGLESGAIYLFTGAESKKISTPVIDRILAEDGVTLDGFFFGGYHYIHLSMGDTTTLTEDWLYCIELDHWFESGFPYYFRFSGQHRLDCVAVNNTDGRVYQWRIDNNVAYHDNGTVYDMTVQTSRINHETNKRKFDEEIRFICDRVTPNALDLPGVSGNYASTPDTSALDITGDIDLRILVAMDDITPSGTDDRVCLMGKWTGASNLSYSLWWNTDTTLRYHWSVNGTASTDVEVVSTVAIPATVDEPIWLRVTHDVNNGASGNTVTFYTSTDGSNWTQLGDAVVTAGTTSLFSGTAVFEIGSATGGTTSLMSGKVFRAEIYNGIAGTLVAEFNATWMEVGATSYSDSTGKTWTVNTSGGTPAAIVEDPDTSLGGEAYDLTVLLEYSDDDYRTWTTWGNFDVTSMNPKLTLGGSFLGGRAYRLTQSFPRQFRCQALEKTYSIGEV